MSSPAVRGEARSRGLDEAWRDAEGGLRLGLDLVERDARRDLDQGQTAAILLVAAHDAEVGDDQVDHAGAGQRQRATLQHLGFASLVGVIHHDDDLLDTGDEIHRAAHALHHLAGDRPIGDVAIRRHFHGAENGQVDMAAADHREGIGRGEEARAWQDRDRLLAGIDQVGIGLALIGKGPMPSRPFSDCSVTSTPSGM